MKTLLGIEITDEEFDRLFCEQSQGKELKVVDGKVVAIEHEITDEERKQMRMSEIQNRLNELSQDFIQVYLGADFGTKLNENGEVINIIDERKEEFITLHNELRELLGKTPRKYEGGKIDEN